MTQHADALKGIAGSTISILGTLTAFQSELEFWTRILAALAAIVASVLTSIYMFKKIRKD